LPAIWLISAGFADRLGANPAEALIRGLGDWTLRLLCLTLAVTPVRKAFHWHALARWRRGLGLWTFVYACLHLLAYAWLDMGGVPEDILRDVAQRPFIMVGMLGWALLLPLALTSFNAAIRWLGSERWQLLHRLVYVVAALALLHFFWMRAGKNHFGEVAIYAAILGGLMVWRWLPRLRIRV
jgi:sulfoxide reductase heme-binding subunit YedZ